MDVPLRFGWGLQVSDLRERGSDIPSRAYHWSCKTREVVDITQGNRTNLTDVSDPGGRIGPYLNGGTPDLRNLDLYLQPCAVGDVILCVSDGVHGTACARAC